MSKKAPVEPLLHNKNVHGDYRGVFDEIPVFLSFYWRPYTFPGNHHQWHRP